jgi:hypothetical protein
MSKRVLVLCQRKVSKLTEDREKVEDVVSRIDEYIALNTPVRAPIGTPEDIPVTVEYLTYHHGERRHEEKQGTETPPAYADHIFLLSRTNQYSSDSIFIEKKLLLEKFLEEHKNTYDVIILNTCPLPWLDYNLIHQVLKSDGVLVVKLFGNPESSPSKEKDKSVVNNIKKNTQNIPLNLFTKLDGQFSGDYTYKKKETQALGRKLKTTKRKRQKNKRVSRRQNIKTRRKQRKQRKQRSKRM